MHLKLKNNKNIILNDLRRYTQNLSQVSLLTKIISNPGFKFLYFFRKSQSRSRKNFLGFIYYFFYRRYSIKYGFQIPRTVDIGSGMLFPHFGNIVINSKTKIGCNCNILQGVTIGNTKGRNGGTPIIGNNVYIGPNAVVVGNIRIGDNVLIAGNSFINFSIPQNHIAIGNPAKIIHRENATAEYINNPYTDQSI